MRPNISDIRKLGDVQALYRWNVRFGPFPTGLATKPTEAELNVRCISTTLPKATNNDMLITLRGHTVEQPGKMTYERRLTLIFIDTVDNVVVKFLNDWRQLTWADGTGVTQNKKELEAVLTLELLDNKDEPRWEYVLTGCFLKDVTLSQLLEESDDASKPEMIISYDYFREGIPGSVTGSTV